MNTEFAEHGDIDSLSIDEIALAHKVHSLARKKIHHVRAAALPPQSMV